MKKRIGLQTTYESKQSVRNLFCILGYMLE